MDTLTFEEDNVDLATLPLDAFTVAPMNSTTGKTFIREHHYSKGSHNGPTCIGLYYKSRLVGVCAFATPCSENVRKSVFGPEHKDRVTELHRLVLLDEVPKNAESWFIVRALKELKRLKPHLWGVLSFADATEGHVGTIYQATNAIYSGTSGRATFYLDKDGRLRHPRQSGVNITPDVAKAKGWTPVKRDGKHRYLFLLPLHKSEKRTIVKALLLDQKPYPKNVTQDTLGS